MSFYGSTRPSSQHLTLLVFAEEKTVWNVKQKKPQVQIINAFMTWEEETYSESVFPLVQRGVGKGNNRRRKGGNLGRSKAEAPFPRGGGHPRNRGSEEFHGSELRPLIHKSDSVLDEKQSTVQRLSTDNEIGGYLQKPLNRMCLRGPEESEDKDVSCGSVNHQMAQSLLHRGCGLNWL